MPETSRPTHRAGRLYAFALTLGLVLLHMPASIPAPLYPIYAQQFGATPASISWMFGTYVAGVVIGLWLVPRWAHRPRAAAGAALASIVGDVVFFVAQDVPTLFLAHVIHGAVLGLFTGLVPIVLSVVDDAVQDSDERRGGLVGRVTTSANAMGLALAPLWSGLLLQVAPLPGQFVWIVQAVLTLALLPLLWRLGTRQATSGRQGSARARNEPGSVVDTLCRPASLASTAVGFGAFASGGLVTALGGLVLVERMGVTSGTLQGVILAGCFIVSAVVGALRFSWSNRFSVLLGLLTVAAGSIWLGFGAWIGSPVHFLLAVLIIGFGQGVGLQGATEVVTYAAERTERSRVVAVFFFTAYLGTVLSTVGIGLLSTSSGLISSVLVFCGCLAALMLLGTVGVAQRFQDVPSPSA